MNMAQKKYMVRRIDETAKQAVKEATQEIASRIMARAQGMKDKIMLGNSVSATMFPALILEVRNMGKKGGKHASQRI